MKLEMRQEARLATDFVTDLTDGRPQEGVGWVECGWLVGNGFCNGFNGWQAAAGRRLGGALRATYG